MSVKMSINKCSEVPHMRCILEIPDDDILSKVTLVRQWVSRWMRERVAYRDARLQKFHFYKLYFTLNSGFCLAPICISQFLERKCSMINIPIFRLSTVSNTGCPIIDARCAVVIEMNWSSKNYRDTLYVYVNTMWDFWRLCHIYIFCFLLIL